MPESRHRHKHQQHHPQQQHTPKPKTKAAGVMAIFTTVLGLGIAFFAAGLSYIWMPVGAIAGGVIGYLIGNGMDKAAEKK
ncbi:MAG: hypothetical protein M3O67_08565 [Bacteroidota bacterium]|nr:hypothetical protein [Bacteroidota bacterium]